MIVGFINLIQTPYFKLGIEMNKYDVLDEIWKK